MPEPERDATMVPVFSMYPPVLVFHRAGAHGRVDDQARHEGANRYEHRTACGRLMSWQEWRDLPERPWSVTLAESNISTTWVRLDHALLVGRPCERCYPVNTKC